MVFDGLSDSKSAHDSKILISIESNLNNALVWVVFTCPLISKFSSLFTKSLEIVPSALITNDIAVTFIFHMFFVYWQVLNIIIIIIIIFLLVCFSH